MLISIIRFVLSVYFIFARYLGFRQHAYRVQDYSASLLSAEQIQAEMEAGWAWYAAEQKREKLARAKEEAQQIRAEEDAAWEAFYAQQEGQEEEEDAESGECSTCGFSFEDCDCFDDEGTAEDAATDFIETYSPNRRFAVIAPEEEQFEEGDCRSCGGNSSECYC